MNFVFRFVSLRATRLSISVGLCGQQSNTCLPKWCVMWLTGCDAHSHSLPPPSGSSRACLLASSRHVDLRHYPEAGQQGAPRAVLAEVEVVVRGGFGGRA